MKKLLLICLASISMLVFFYSCDDLGKSSEVEMLTFKIDTIEGTITGVNVTITLPFGTDVTKLAPVITISDLATISPASGTVQDFTNPVEYTITAEDGNEAIVVVTVKLKDPSKKELITLAPWIKKSEIMVYNIDSIIDRLATKDICYYDEVITIKADNTFTFDPKTVCDPNDDKEISTGIWSFSADEKYFIVQEKVGARADSMEIGKLDTKTLELISRGVDKGKNYVNTSTLVHP